MHSMPVARCSAKRRWATSVGQARKLVALVEGKQAVFQVGLQRRASAIYRQAAMVQTGMLGRITAVQCEWCRNNNWRRPMPVPRGHADFGKLNHQLNWRLFRDTSQGLMVRINSTWPTGSWGLRLSAYSRRAGSTTGATGARSSITIDSESDDTRDELVSFVEHVQHMDRATI